MSVRSEASRKGWVARRRQAARIAADPALAARVEARKRREALQLTGTATDRVMSGASVGELLARIRATTSDGGASPRVSVSTDTRRPDAPPAQEP